MINKTIVCKGFLHLFYKFFCKTLFSLKMFIQTDKVFQSIFTRLPGGGNKNFFNILAIQKKALR